MDRAQQAEEVKKALEEMASQQDAYSAQAAEFIQKEEEKDE